MSAMVCLNIETRVEELERLFSAVEDMGQKEDWPSELVFQVNLTLEELGLNIMNHGHPDGIHEIEIVLNSDPQTLTIEIIDDGRPFDPLKDAPAPDLTGSIEDRPIGGLGIHLVKSIMDEIHYQREEGKNRLKLVKRRGQ